MNAGRQHVADRGSIDRRVGAIDGAQLTGPVRSVLGDEHARVTEWRCEPVVYDFLNPSSGGVYRFAGTATRREGSVPWRLVLKVTRSAEDLEYDSPLPAELADTFSRALRWDRELLAYESGFLGRIDGDLAAPNAHGWARNDDGTAWLWLEDLTGAAGGTWPLERYGEAGRALGAFNGSYLADGHAPDHDWLGRDWLGVWVLQITPFEFGRFLESAAWAEPAARRAYPGRFRDRVLELWADRKRLLEATRTLPRTCSHLDAHRRNLFVRDGRFLAIDWGLLGLAPPGEEIASTLVGTVASGELAAEEAPPLAALLFESYLDGLRTAGWRGDARDVRLAFTAAAALRAFSVLALDTDDEERLARSSTLARLLLDLGDEARSLS